VHVDALRRYLKRHTQSTESELPLAAEVAPSSHELETVKGAIQVRKTRSPVSLIAVQSTAIFRQLSHVEEPSMHEPQPCSALAFTKDAASFVGTLQPLWAPLPSLEAGDARLYGATQPFSPDSGQTSPSMWASALGTFGPNVNAVSLRRRYGKPCTQETLQRQHEHQRRDTQSWPRHTWLAMIATC
jgi:hypothetical protein